MGDGTVRGRAGAALLLVALMTAPPIASADWIEVYPSSARMDVPRAGVGTANVPVPNFRSETTCVLSGIVLLCIELPRFAGMGEREAPAPVVWFEQREVPWADVHVWSPVAVRYACGAVGENDRYAALRPSTDLSGDHTYYPTREVNVTTPPNFVVAYAFDYACRRTNGMGVPEHVLP